jgi:hypothetical protein
MPASRRQPQPHPLSKLFTDTELTQIKQRVQSNLKLQKLGSSLNGFLRASEYQLIQMMIENKVWNGPKPPDPGGQGSVEFGLLPYWLSTAPARVKWAWTKVAGGLPGTKINKINYTNLMKAIEPPSPGLVASDGTIYGQGTYEALDLKWVEAVAKYLDHYFREKFAPFATTPAVISAGAGSQISVALLGDWGTGNYKTGPAASVMSAVSALKPDYIVHLGDVYYAGTASEERARLLSLWPRGYSGKSFTLNSNHEMYDGAFGYFRTALTDPIFSAQKQTSYFALQYGKWTILGLDSSYWSTSPLVMNGSISESGSSKPGADAQPQFIKDLKLNPDNVIVLTHHNAIEYDGSSIVKDILGANLWLQVTKALKGEPASWYWGHVHNGIVYPNPTFTKNHSFYRCVGHGAIPYGKAWGLSNAPATHVKAYANTPNPKASPIRVMNGFVLLTITSTGKVTETFYEQDGKVAPWVKPFTYQLGAKARKAGAGH